eukprot:m.100282 g.100282  ORF g.100282 m.100282 type:complete len:56 (-) comp13164_c0_seq4:1739-1906(-)
MDKTQRRQLTVINHHNTRVERSAISTATNKVKGCVVTRKAADVQPDVTPGLQRDA